MAALRFELSPDGETAVTRLAHRSIIGQVHTWNTDVCVTLRADGSGYVDVRRDGRTLQTFSIPAEGMEPVEGAPDVEVSRPARPDCPICKGTGVGPGYTPCRACEVN